MKATKAKNVNPLPILTLSNGKNIYIDGNSFTNDEAHEVIVSLTQAWGNDFEKQELTDRFFGIQPTGKVQP